MTDNNSIPCIGARKWANALAAYKGFRGTQTVAHIRRQIPQQLADTLTGAQLGCLMDALHAVYHEGRASTGAEIIDDSATDGAVWIGGRLQRMIGWSTPAVMAEYPHRERATDLVTYLSTPNQ